MTDEVLSDCNIMAYTKSSKVRALAECYSPYVVEKDRYVKMGVTLKEGK